jgi:hypothetical protein
MSMKHQRAEQQRSRGHTVGHGMTGISPGAWEPVTLADPEEVENADHLGGLVYPE